MGATCSGSASCQLDLVSREGKGKVQPGWSSRAQAIETYPSLHGGPGPGPGKGPLEGPVTVQHQPLIPGALLTSISLPGECQLFVNNNGKQEDAGLQRTGLGGGSQAGSTG